MPKSAYWEKMCILNEKFVYWSERCLLGGKVPTKRCLLKYHNSSYWIYKKVSIDRKDAYWQKMCLPKGVYWKVTTIYIGYTKMCLLIEKMPID